MLTKRVLIRILPVTARWANNLVRCDRRDSRPPPVGSKANLKAFDRIYDTSVTTIVISARKAMLAVFRASGLERFQSGTGGAAIRVQEITQRAQKPQPNLSRCRTAGKTGLRSGPPPTHQVSFVPQYNGYVCRLSFCCTAPPIVGSTILMRYCLREGLQWPLRLRNGLRHAWVKSAGGVEERTLR
jgi:hypothetical protein